LQRFLQIDNGKLKVFRLVILAISVCDGELNDLLI